MSLFGSALEIELFSRPGCAAFGMFVSRFESITGLVETFIASANVITGFF